MAINDPIARSFLISASDNATMKRLVFILANAIFILLANAAQADHELLNRDILRGESLYHANCAVCHGAKLEGQPNWRQTLANGTLPAPPHDETGHTWHHDDNYLIEYTIYGGQGLMNRRGISGFKSAMPAFGELLSRDDILSVLAFIRSTWPDDIKAVQASRNASH